MMKNNNRRGISVVEIVVAIAIASLIAIVASGFFNQMNFFKKNKEQEIQMALEQFIGNKVIWDDFRGAGPSFNLLNLASDDNKAFYEYRYDQPCISNSSECQRAFKLSLDNGATVSKKFYVITKDTDFIQNTSNPTAAGLTLNTITIQPEKFYTVSGSTLSYQPTSLADELSTQFDISKSDLSKKLLMFYIPTPIRQPDASVGAGDPPFDYSQAPLLYSFLTNIDSSGSDTSISSIINTIEPNFGYSNKELMEDFVSNSTSINTVDRFLLNMPGIYGSVPLVLVQPVSVIRYYLELEDPNETMEQFKRARLVREVLMNTGSGLEFQQKFTVSVGIQEVTFLRNNITTPVISYKIKYDNQL